MYVIVTAHLLHLVNSMHFTKLIKLSYYVASVKLSGTDRPDLLQPTCADPENFSRGGGSEG